MHTVLHREFTHLLNSIENLSDLGRVIRERWNFGRSFYDDTKVSRSDVYVDAEVNYIFCIYIPDNCI